MRRLTAPEMAVPARAGTNNLGSRAVLDGLQNDSSAKLIKAVDYSESYFPWLITVTAEQTSGATTALLGPIVSGEFGVGSVVQTVEFDAKPDTVIALPGVSVDLTARWDYLLQYSNAGAPPVDIVSKIRSTGGFSLLPLTAVVKATAKHGIPSYPNATRTISAQAVGAGNHTCDMTVPPFVTSFDVSVPNDVDYGNITSLYLIGTNFVRVTYTGAQLLALKNAGSPVPIPGGIDRMQWVLSAPINWFTSFRLNL